MLSENYSYAERPAALILGRRGFLKVSGLCVGAAVVCGWAIGDMVAAATRSFLPAKPAFTRMTSSARPWVSLLPTRTRWSCPFTRI